jgi:hypothetical protein
MLVVQEELPLGKISIVCVRVNLAGASDVGGIIYLYPALEDRQFHPKEWL